MSFLDDLLTEFKRAEPKSPHDRAAKAALRASGASVDPRPATDPWPERVWTPSALIVKTHMQHCLSCDSTAESLVGYFLKSTSPDGAPDRKAVRLQRVDSAHPGLTEELETTEEDVHQCPLCIRLDRLLLGSAPSQLSLFPVARYGKTWQRP